MYLLCGSYLKILGVVMLMEDISNVFLQLFVFQLEAMFQLETYLFTWPIVVMLKKVKINK